MIKQMAKENRLIQMEMFMKEIGEMIKPMEMEFIHILTGLSILAIGSMTNNLAMELKFGQMLPGTRVNI